MIGILRIAKHVVAAAVVLALGAELLALTTSIVVLVRLGNITPLIVLAVLTFGIIYQSGRMKTEEGKKLNLAKTVLDAMSLVLGGMLCLTIFFIALPSGIVMLLGSIGGTCVLMALVRNPGKISMVVSMPYASVLRHDISSLNLRVFELEKGQREGVLRMLDERSLLRVSIWILQDLDTIIFPTRHSESVRGVLDEYGLQYSRMDMLLESAVLALPLSDSVRPEEYVSLVPSLRERVIERWPVRMMLFPSPEGVSVLVPRSIVRGMPTEPLSSGQAYRAVVCHELVTGDNLA